MPDTERVPGRSGHGFVPWLYALPMIVVVGLTLIIPAISLFVYSMQSVGRSEYMPTKYVGTDNFKYVLSDDVFRQAIINNAKLFACVPLLVMLAAFVAAALHDRPRGWRVYQALVFLPYVLAIPVIGIVFGELLARNGGLNELLRSVGLDVLAQDWLGSPSWAIITIGAIIVWKELGLGVMIFLARLTTVGDELRDAARLDGASWLRRMWHVTLPQLVPALIFFAVLELIVMLSWVFAYVYVITRGGPENSTVVTEYYIYQQVFQNNAIGIGAATGVLLLVAVCFIVGLRALVERRIGERANG